MTTVRERRASLRFSVEVNEMVIRLLALLMFVAGVAITFGFQYKVGERPTFNVRKWKPIWHNPAYNRKPAFWLGICLFLVGAGLIGVAH